MYYCDVDVCPDSAHDAGIVVVAFELVADEQRVTG